MNKWEAASFCEAIQAQLEKEISNVNFDLFLVPKLSKGHEFKSNGIARISFDIEVDVTNMNDIARKVADFWSNLRNKIELDIER
jgi:hypothetical protein